MKAAFLAALALLAAVPAAAKDVSAGHSSNGAAFGLKRGDTLTVRLPSNGTTGFAWSIAELPPVLRAAGDDYLAPARPLPGAGGTQVLRFTASRSGRGRLRLAYRRPWERNGAPAEVFAITVSVR